MSKTESKNNKINKRIDGFRKSGKLKQAIETCMSAIAEDENNAELHIKLGDLYMENHLDISQAGQYADEAITEYQRALESCVDLYELHYKIAGAFFCKREFDRALNYYKSAVEHGINTSESYYMTAQIYLRKGNFHEALLAAEKAVKAGPFKASRAYYLKYYIMSHIKKGKKLEKLALLLFSVLTLPFDKEGKKATKRYLSNLKYIPAMLRAGYVIYTEGFTDKAVEIYRDILDKAPGYTELYIVLGRIYAELKRYEDAICELKMAIWLDSLNIKAYYYLCLIYEEQKDYENAALTCQKLIELQPYTADFQCRMAQYLYMSGETDAAVEHYQNAITLSNNPKWTGIVAQTLGYIFRENTGDLDAAVSAYQHAYKSIPDDIEISLDLGSVFFEKCSYDNALIVYKKALEKFPESARLHCNLGYLYWGKGNIEEAVKEYENAIKYDNKYDIAYNNLGVIYLDDLGLVQKAIELFEEARKHNPDYALANYNLARSVAVTGDKIEAAKLYKQAADINNYTQELDPAEIEEKIRDLFE